MTETKDRGAMKPAQTYAIGAYADAAERFGPPLQVAAGIYQGEGGGR